MSRRIVQTVEEIVRAPIEEMGFDLDEVEFKKEGADYVLTVYIDAPEGVTLNDCESVSRAIDPLIEAADPIEQMYYLSVSSIGLDRPLKKQRDYERNLGKRITVKLFSPINKKKEFTGTLTGYDEEAITLATDEEKMLLRLKDIALAKPYIDFN